MTTETILLLIVLVLLIGALPAWPHSKSWGYGPTGVLTLLLVVFLFWALLGERPLFRSSGHEIKDTIQEAGQDLKAAGRDVADSVRDVVK